MVATYISGAFWFTASDFANPAVTIARALINTFASSRPIDVPAFLLAQLLGASVAAILFRWPAPRMRQSLSRITSPPFAAIS